MGVDGVDGVGCADGVVGDDGVDGTGSDCGEPSVTACCLLSAVCCLLSAVLLDSDPGFLNGSSGSLTRIVNFPGSLLLLFFSSFIILEFFAVFKL